MSMHGSDLSEFETIYKTALEFQLLSSMATYQHNSHNIFVETNV